MGAKNAQKKKAELPDGRQSIGDFKDQEPVDTLLELRSVARRKKRQEPHDPFLYIKLGEDERTVDVRIWLGDDGVEALDQCEEELRTAIDLAAQEGKNNWPIVRVKGIFDGGRFGPQINDVDLDLDPDLEDFDPDELKVKEPVEGDRLVVELEKRVEGIEFEPRRELARRRTLEGEAGHRFQHAPAAKRYHHAHEHGLLMHSLQVAGATEAVAEALNFLREYMGSDSDPVEYLEELIGTVTCPPLQSLLRQTLLKGEFAERWQVAPMPMDTIDYRGQERGLLWQTLRTVVAAEAVTGVFEELDRDLVIAGTLLARTGEADCQLPGGLPTDLTAKGRYAGVVWLSACRARTAPARGEFWPELGTALDHIVLSHRGKPGRGSPVAPQTREAHAVHLMHVLADRMVEFAAIDVEQAMVDGLLHDAGKGEVFELDGTTVKPTTEGRLLGEMWLGSIANVMAARSIDGFTPELMLACTHGVLSHHGTLEYGSMVLPMTAEAVLVHVVDDLGARMGSFDRIERQLTAGSNWCDYDTALGAGAFFGSTTPTPVSDVEEEETPDIDAGEALPAQPDEEAETETESKAEAEGDDDDAPGEVGSDEPADEGETVDGDDALPDYGALPDGPSKFDDVTDFVVDGPEDAAEPNGSDAPAPPDAG